MTEQQVREIVREELSQEKPFRGGWFTGTIRGVTRRRWRDPQTGDVFFDDKMRASGMLFDEYTNVQWEDDEPVRQEWPPAGLPVLVQHMERGRWKYGESMGDGWFRCALDAAGFTVHAWQYIPANWDNAPEWARFWIVLSSGEQLWIDIDIDKQIYYDDVTLVHVEGRP